MVKKDLKEIFINPKVGNFCTEIGPNGFRIDWGTFVAVEKPKLLAFKWQIGLNRDPIPNPDKASLVTIEFKAHSSTETTIELKYSQFKEHGEQYLPYLKAKDSNQGWSFILECLKDYIEK